MIQVITATFEDGVLKPNEPLHLPPTPVCGW
jgi:predicted DNA-binding antitoxin AbrB/MazE fold protein